MIIFFDIILSQIIAYLFKFYYIKNNFIWWF